MIDTRAYCTSPSCSTWPLPTIPASPYSHSIDFNLCELLLQDFAEKIFGFRSQHSLLQAKTEVKLSSRHANRLESFGPSTDAPSAMKATQPPAVTGNGSGGRGSNNGGGISSFFSSASTSSFFSSSSSVKSSTNIPMSQYGQQATSSSEKKYVIGSMTTRKEIEQDAKDDILQFNITFSEVSGDFC